MNSVRTIVGPLLAALDYIGRDHVARMPRNADFASRMEVDGWMIMSDEQIAELTRKEAKAVMRDLGKRVGKELGGNFMEVLAGDRPVTDMFDGVGLLGEAAKERTLREELLERFDLYDGAEIGLGGGGLIGPKWSGSLKYKNGQVTAIGGCRWEVRSGLWFHVEVGYGRDPWLDAFPSLSVGDEAFLHAFLADH